MPWRTSARISSSSSAVGGRFSIPIAHTRTELCPTKRKAFTPIPSSSQAASWAATSALPLPSTPSATLVIPWKRKARASRPWSVPSSACECMSMNPGVTRNPVTSTVSTAVTPAAEASPTKTIRSPVTATSAAAASAPLPSSTDPPVKSRSAGASPSVHEAGRRRSSTAARTRPVRVRWQPTPRRCWPMSPRCRRLPRRCRPAGCRLDTAAAPQYPDRRRKNTPLSIEVTPITPLRKNG